MAIAITPSAKVSSLAVSERCSPDARLARRFRFAVGSVSM